MERTGGGHEAINGTAKQKKEEEWGMEGHNGQGTRRPQAQQQQTGGAGSNEGTTRGAQQQHG